MERTVRVLNQMVDDKIISSYAIAGAMGALFYTEPLETHDLDVLAVLPVAGFLITLDPIYRYLEARGYCADREHVCIEGIPVQFMPISSPLTQAALDNAVTHNVGSTPVRVVASEYLIAMALSVGRPKDYARVAHLLKANVNKALLKQILQKYDLMKKWDSYNQLFGQD